LKRYEEGKGSSSREIKGGKRRKNEEETNCGSPIEPPSK
jgi:hypothetical protein